MFIYGQNNYPVLHLSIISDASGNIYNRVIMFSNYVFAIYEVFETINSCVRIPSDLFKRVSRKHRIVGEKIIYNISAQDLYNDLLRVFSNLILK